MTMLIRRPPTINPGGQHMHSPVRELSGGRVKDAVRALITRRPLQAKKIVGRPSLQEIFSSL